MEKATREEKTRYCRMKGRVGEEKTSSQKREQEDEGSKKEKKSLGWNAISSSRLFVAPS